VKYLIIAIAMLSGSMLAQSGSVNFSASTAGHAPSYSQMYCSGFITRDAIPRQNFVVGSKESPHEDQFSSRSELFLGGPALVEGQRYSLLRQVTDPNHEDSSPEQRKKLAGLGAAYQEIGWVTVHSVQKSTAVATFDFSCDSAVRGDIVVPFREKPAIQFRATDAPMDSFRQSNTAPKGQILGAKDFEELLGDGRVVYTDFGSAKGAKAGDYLVITRGYAPEDLNKIDRASEQLPKGAEATSVDPAQVRPDADNHAPLRVLGELFILETTRGTSTAVITRAISEIGLGDVVQSEDPNAAAAELAPETDTPPCQPASRLHRLTHLQRHAACEPAKAK